MKCLWPLSQEMNVPLAHILVRIHCLHINAVLFQRPAALTLPEIPKGFKIDLDSFIKVLESPLQRVATAYCIQFWAYRYVLIVLFHELASDFVHHYGMGNRENTELCHVDPP